ASSTYCYGKTTVPNTYGSKVSEARETLFSSGFKKSVDTRQNFPVEKNSFVEAGITEFGGCEEKRELGVMLCRFYYTNGSSLVSLMTVGKSNDLPQIAVGEFVQCYD
ncbi:MAG: hypothetical protein ACJ0DF_13570, partial [Paracoccaceae bacterium]